MLNRLFGKRPLKRAETGIYKVENGVLVELEDSPGNGSINSINEYLGYDISQVVLIKGGLFSRPNIK